MSYSTESSDYELLEAEQQLLLIAAKQVIEEYHRFQANPERPAKFMNEAVANLARQLRDRS